MIERLSMLNVLGMGNEMSKSRRITQEAGSVIIGSIFIALMSQLAFILPFTPVPVTGQTFAILLIAVLYGGKRAGITISAYLIEGLSGLPVFAKAGFGIVHLLGPSGGYLVGFLISALVVGYFSNKGYSKSFWKNILIMSLGNIIIYLIGATWLSVYLGIAKAFSAGVLPFIPGDILKIMLISSLLPITWKILKK